MEKWKKVKLGDLLEEYCERNVNQEYKVVAVGKYGIRKREDIYSKELSKDISKNKIIMKNTLTIGMGSNQIDIGILTEDKKFCVSPAYTTYKIKNCNSQFLEYYLQFLNPKLSDLFMVISARQGKSVDKEGLLKYEIYIPPLDQQTKIVEILKKVDSIIDKYDKLLKEKNQFIKSQFVEMFAKYKNQKNVQLNELSEFVTVGIANSATQEYATNGIVMLRNQNIKENYLDDANLIYINKEFSERYKNKKLRENDILVTRTGYPGIACIVPKKYEDSQTFTTLIIRLKENPNIDAHYICYYINSIYGKTYVKNNQAGVAQQNFGATALGKMPIFIPPIDNQKIFVKLVQQIGKQKSLLEKQVENYKKLKKVLMQRLLTGKVK